MEPVRGQHLEEIQDRLGRLARRLRLRDSWLLAQRTLWGAALAAVVVQVLGRLWPLENLWVWTLVPAALWLPGWLAYSMLRPMPSMRVARRVDTELGLKERLSTALALQGRSGEAPPAGSRAPNTPAFPVELVALQGQDTLQTIRRLDPARAFPLGLLKRPLLAALLLSGAAVTMAMLPNPMDDVLQERAAIAQEAEIQAERIEELGEEIEESQELSPEMKEELLRQLRELAEQLRANTGDRAEALADLSRLEEALRERMDPNAGMRQAALEALAAQLQALAERDASENADLSTAAEDLARLAEEMANMDESERQALAQSLAQMAARAAQAGSGDLAQALASMAQAAQSGDSDSASQAAQSAADALQQAQSQLSDQEALQRALSQLQGSRQRMAQAGQRRSVARIPGQGEGEGEGQGQGQGEGQDQGQGQGQGQGQPGGGGGTRADTLPPGESSGQAGRPEGEGRPGGETDPGDQVFAPWERRPDSGNEIFIPGQDTEQGETQVREQKDPLPGAVGPSLMPYYEVFQSYMDAANQSIEQSYIPSSLKDYVRDYFSELEP